MNNDLLATPDLGAFQKPYFFFAVDQNLTLTYVSPSVEQVLGYAAEELVGSRLSTLIEARHGSCAQPSEPNNCEVPAADCQDALIVAKAQDGTPRALRIQTHARRNGLGQVTVSHGLAQDVTESYFVEQELRSRLADLQRIESELTDREREVLERVIGGRLNKLIAKELGVTQRAVERIRSRLMQKFQATTSAELVSMATEFRILNNLVVDHCHYA